MKSVLILSHREGFEADPVIDELTRRNQPYFRFNLDDGNAVSAASVTIDGSTSIRFECDGKTLDAADIGVAWLQQPPPYMGQPSDEAACLQRTTLQTMNDSCFSLLECPWFNRYSTVLNAGSKIRQLHLAQKVNLPLVPTLVSNDPASIRDFCAGGETIAKNVATPWLANGNETVAAFTKLVQSDWLTNDAELRFAPVIYQRYCRRARDYRVVAVGSEFFPICCTPVSGQEEDIRRTDHTGSGYERCQFDSGLLTKLSALMRELGVDYCSADFMEDEAGNIFFLETNICGAWWWVDKYFDGTICQTITDQILGKM